MQLFIVRAWCGASARLHLAARRARELDWTPLAAPEDLIGYLHAALAEVDAGDDGRADAVQPGTNASGPTCVHIAPVEFSAADSHPGHAAPTFNCPQPSSKSRGGARTTRLRASADTRSRK
jgi:hypothetical protein